MKTVAFVSSAFALTLAVAASASAGVSYSGTPGPNGNTGVDAFGNSWAWNYTILPAGALSPGPGFSAWGTPGLGDTVVPYGAHAQVEDEFTVTFTPVFSGTTTTINQTPSSDFGGYNEDTRFEDGTAGVAWTPIYVGGLSVSFVAPTGAAMAPGDLFFVNVIFTGSDLNGGNTGFTADFGPSAPPAGVPEPMTWALMLVGVAAAGASLRRRHGMPASIFQARLRRA